MCLEDTSYFFMITWHWGFQNAYYSFYSISAIFVEDTGYQWTTMNVIALSNQPSFKHLMALTIFYMGVNTKIWNYAISLTWLIVGGNGCKFWDRHLKGYNCNMFFMLYYPSSVWCFCVNLKNFPFQDLHNATASIVFTQFLPNFMINACTCMTVLEEYWLLLFRRYCIPNFHLRQVSQLHFLYIATRHKHLVKG